MKQAPAFHPVLFAAFPILAVFSANSALFPLIQIFRPLLVSVGLALLVWMLLWALLRDRNRSAIATSVFILCFFSFDWLFDWMIDDELNASVLAAWILFTTGATAIATWKFKWHRFANILSVCLCLVSATSIAYTSIRKLSPSQRVADVKKTADSSAPDILYIVLDGYGRTDQLARTIGYDDKWFIDELSRRGFYIATDSHSNYSQTDLSLASVLNMDTIQTLLPNADSQTADRLPLFRLIDDNRVANHLRLFGYKYIGVRSGFPGIRFETADYVPQSGPRTTLFEATILQLTPLRLSSTAIGSLYDSRRRDLLRAFRHLKDLSAPTTSPRFIVAHIIAPHPPFVFDAEGRPVRPSGPFGFFDGSHYMQLVGDEMDYKTGYADQAQFIAKQTLKVVDAFITKSNVQPIIIIQGDHGSKLHLDQESLENTDVQECFSILNAFLVPPDLKPTLYPSISSINTFRLLLSNLFRLDLPLLPDHSFYSTISRPYHLIDVTPKLRSEKPNADLPTTHQSP